MIYLNAVDRDRGHSLNFKIEECECRELDNIETVIIASAKRSASLRDLSTSPTGSGSPLLQTQPVGPFAQRIRSRSDARMADNRTISQLEADGYPWIGCECCKGTVWLPFKMIRESIPALSAWTLDELGAKMKCEKCGKRPERFYPARQSDAPGFARSF